MNNLKKLIMIITAAVMAVSFGACNNDDNVSENSSDTSSTESSGTSEETTEAATVEGTVQAPIPQEYDGTEVPDAAAQVISDYFTAIMNQDYDAYVETLDPYYFEVYNSWLDGSFGYGMETSFESMHQSLMDSAVTANGDADVTEMVITKVQLKESEPAEGEDEYSVDDYLAQYDNVISEGFAEELKAQCDDVVSVTFTLFADCDGKELEIMTDMEILLTVHGDEYKVMG